jgi:low affinity Fe/Cu permease
MTNSEHTHADEVNQDRQRGVDEQRQRVEAERPTGRWRGRRSFRDSSVATAHAPGWELRHWTSRLLHGIGELAAHSGAGVLAALLIVVWAAIGFIVGFPSWWQITLYSVATSVTFVMVFVIQHTQERQTSATQRKLDELIRSSLRADNNLIAVEQASDQDLQALGSLNLVDRERASGDVAHDEPSTATDADQ